MFDYIEFFDNFGIEYWTSGKNVPNGGCTTRCCHCDDNSNHLIWNRISTYCWKCGSHSLISSIKETLNVDYKEASSIKKQYDTYIDSIQEVHEYHN